LLVTELSHVVGLVGLLELVLFLKEATVGAIPLSSPKWDRVEWDGVGYRWSSSLKGEKKRCIM
jgi:hypothetical protein